MQRLRHRLQERARSALGHQSPPRRDDQRRQARRALDLHGLHALHRCALRGGVSDVDASTPRRMRWCCTTRTPASAAATASMLAPSVRRSIRASATSAAAARWTSAPTAPAARSRTIRRRNTRSTAPTAWRKASCRCAPKCAPPRRCWPATGRSSPRSIVNACSSAAMAPAPGAGVPPIAWGAVVSRFLIALFAAAFLAAARRLRRRTWWAPPPTRCKRRRVRWS